MTERSVVASAVGVFGHGVVVGPRLALSDNPLH